MKKDMNEFFMNLAVRTSEQATCKRLKVGALIVKETGILGVGYNSSLDGHPTCEEDDCLMYENGCKRTVHAEMRALLDCAKRGVSVNGGTAYVTHYPCPDCMKHLNEAGVKKVYYKRYYAHRYSNSFNDGMQLIQL